ncbi:hypothetical protein ACLMJK_000876 [Lecanora helva]
MHSIMQSAMIIFLTSLLSFIAALPSPSSSSPLLPRANLTLTECQDVLDSGLNATCYDTLNVDAWVKNWNTTTKTCQPNELWANCFMREAGVPAEGGLGCAQIGPSCNEPTADLLATSQPEQIYTAFSIWALQQLYTALYDDIITSENSTSYIATAWESPTSPKTGKSLLANILLSDSDPRTQFLGLQVTTSIPVPGVEETPLTDQESAPQAIGRVLAAYLESSMTNFTLGGYWGMAGEGKLIV